MNERPSRTAFLAFALMLAIALLLKDLQIQAGEGPFRTWAEHFSIALLVAAILGFTFAYLEYQDRVHTLRGLLEESRTKVFEALSAFGVLTPEGIFRMLKDIASQTVKTPTLYIPAREESKEYTFAESIGFFDTLFEVRRKEIVDILRSWIEPKSYPNVKFLASDFIGKYRLCQLADNLRQQAEPILYQGDLEEADRGWVLNYIWAASRCEEPMYKSLGEILRSTKDQNIEAWILFVPLQMPSEEFGEIIENYLGREASIAQDNLKRAIRAIAALHKAEKCNGVEILKKYKNRFSGLETDMKEIWGNYVLPQEELKNVLGNERGTG